MSARTIILAKGLKLFGHSITHYVKCRQVHIEGLKSKCESALRLVCATAKGRPFDPIIHAAFADTTPGFNQCVPVSLPPLSIGGAFIDALGNILLTHYSYH